MPAVSTQHAIRINDFQKAEETEDKKNVNTVRGSEQTTQQGSEGGSHIPLWFLLLIWHWIPFHQATCYRDQTRPDLARFSARQTPVCFTAGLCRLTTGTVYCKKIYISSFRRVNEKLQFWKHSQKLWCRTKLVSSPWCLPHGNSIQRLIIHYCSQINNRQINT